MLTERKREISPLGVFKRTLTEVYSRVLADSPRVLRISLPSKENPH